MVRGCGRWWCSVGGSVVRSTQRSTQGTLRPEHFLVEVISLSTSERGLLDPPVARADRGLHRLALGGVVAGALADQRRGVTGRGLGRRECRRGRGGQPAGVVQDTTRDRVGAEVL